MRVSKLFLIAALATSLSAQAQLTDKGVVSPGLVGPMDNSQAILLGTHPGDLAGFLDAYIFSILTPGIVGGAIDMTLLGPNVLPADQAAIAGIFLLDSGGNALLQDIDGADGFILNTVLPAGTYGFGVLGAGGNGGGLYSGVLASINPPVPEPQTYAMMLGGLGLLAGVSRRLRKRT